MENVVFMAEALNVVTFTPGVYTGGLRVLPSELILPQLTKQL